MDAQPRTFTETLQEMFSTSNQLAARFAAMEGATSLLKDFRTAAVLEKSGLIAQMNQALSLNRPAIDAIMGTRRMTADLQAAMAPLHSVTEGIRRINEFYAAEVKAATRLAAMTQLPPSLTDKLQGLTGLQVQLPSPLYVPPAFPRNLMFPTIIHRPTLPTAVADELRSTVVGAYSLAEVGELAEGYSCLLVGLRRAEGARAAGYRWAEELIQRYKDKLEQFRRKYGVPME